MVKGAATGQLALDRDGESGAAAEAVRRASVAQCCLGG